MKEVKIVMNDYGVLYAVHQLLETIRYIAAYTSGLSHLDYDTIMDDLKEIEDETWDASQT